MNELTLSCAEFHNLCLDYAVLSSWVWVTFKALLVMALCPTLIVHCVYCVVAWIYETLNLFSEIYSK